MGIAEESSWRVRAPKLMAHALCPELRVAIITSGRNLFAPPPRIECMVRPFDLGVSSHGSGL
jgi:hypothetical protein